MKAWISAALAASTLLLGGCGGSSGTPATNGSGPSYSTLMRRGAALSDATKYASPTVASRMPKNGSATYTGISGFTMGDTYGDADLVSEAKLKADFRGNSISGELTNFRDSKNIPLNGTVEVLPGRIAGSSFATAMTGDLTKGGENLPVKGSVVGTFAGTNAQYAIALAEGTLKNQTIKGVILAGPKN